VSDSRPIPGIPNGLARRAVDVPHRLTNGVRYSPLGEVGRDRLLLQPSGIGRYCVQGGSCIDFCAVEKANSFAVERFLWNNALAGLIHQRGELPLHASAARSPCGQHAVAICGASGAGKSTMAANLTQRGWQSLCDDMTRITLQDGVALAWPGTGGIRLLRDAIERLNIARSGLVNDGDTAGKFLIPTPCSSLPASLTAIVVLGGHELLPRLEMLHGAAALAALVPNISGPRKLRAVGRLPEHFMFMQLLLKRCRVYRLHGRYTASADVLSQRICDALS
jgi:hypothetical protein